MQRRTENLVAADLSCPAGSGNLSHPATSKPTAPASTVGNWGFTLPVLVVCAALWFLLSAHTPV